MRRVLANPIFAQLYAAQIVSLMGTGLLTIALGLLAFDLAGDKAGAVLGIAFAIKMIAYVGVSPLANALTQRLPRKAVLIATDLVRAGAALCLPFIDAVWQVYVLIFVLQTASATFSPTFQALIPDVLDDERDYTHGLSLSRLAYEIENLLSPTLAALMLTVMSYHGLFAGTVVGFLLSAVLIARPPLPMRRQAGREAPFWDRVSHGTRLYLATAPLRGLLALNMAAAAVGAFLLVNTVVVVKSGYGGSETDVAYAMAALGLGSMAAALAMPPLLDRFSERRVLLGAGCLLTVLGAMLTPLVDPAGLPPWLALLALWATVGFLYTLIMAPAGRLLRRTGSPTDRGHLFTAHFALSHACWLVTYPVAGLIGGWFGLAAAMGTLTGLAIVGTLAALALWPRERLAKPMPQELS